MKLRLLIITKYSRLIATALALTTMLSLPTGAQAQSKRGFEYYGAPNLRMTLPPNNLHLQDRVNVVANISEERFGQIIDEVMIRWIQIAKIKGVTLSVDKNWTDPTVNAFASQNGQNWKVAMFGGLARRPEVTEDGFALVVCHELGHHFGGYAFYTGSGMDWASAEGESDYFATDVCAKYVWGKNMQRNLAYGALATIPPIVKQSCNAAWERDANARGWCVRTAASGLSLANLLAAIGSQAPPKFDKPDKTQVPQTNTSHPNAQCRLDTYFQGALCTKKWDLAMIPARGFPGGQDSLGAEVEAMKYSCFTKQHFKLGTRPLCWFKPLN